MIEKYVKIHFTKNTNDIFKWSFGVTYNMNPKAYWGEPGTVRGWKNGLLGEPVVLGDERIGCGVVRLG